MSLSLNLEIFIAV